MLQDYYFLHTSLDYSTFLGHTYTSRFQCSSCIRHNENNTTHQMRPHSRVGVNSAPELDFLANSKSNSGIGIELELALPSPGGIGIELELPSFELELNSELPSWN